MPHYANPSQASEPAPRRQKARPGRPRKDQELVSMRLDSRLLATMRDYAQEGGRTLDSVINSALGYFLRPTADDEPPSLTERELATLTATLTQLPVDAFVRVVEEAHSLRRRQASGG